MPVCPCGSQRDFEECCSPIIGGAPAPTAEALMRSRYSAIVKRQLDHVEQTHAPEIRAEFNRAEAERLAQECEWLGLEIRRATETGDTAEVEFVLRFRQDGQNLTKKGVSQFRRDQGRWLYVSGTSSQHITQRRVSKVGRNDPCPCNSGKKAKHCCGTTTELS